MAENSPDSLKDSYINFFSNYDIDIKKMYKGRKDINGSEEGFEDIFSLYISGKSCRKSSNDPNDTEYSRQNDLAELAEISPDSDSENGGNVLDFVILRFLQAVPAFIGVDMRKYGPFSREDVATIPPINAKNLVRSGHVLEVHAAIGPHSRRDEPCQITAKLADVQAT